MCGLPFYWTREQERFSAFSPVRLRSVPVQNARRAVPRTAAQDDVSRGHIEGLAVICWQEVAFYGRTGRIVNLGGRTQARETANPRGISASTLGALRVMQFLAKIDYSDFVRLANFLRRLIKGVL